MTRSDKNATVPTPARPEIVTLANLVVDNACGIRSSLARVLALALDHVDVGSWNRVTAEQAVLHLYLLSEHAHQVLRERDAQAVVSEVADRVGQGLAHRLGRSRADQKEVVLYFGETLKARFASYRGQPIVVDPDSGETVDIESFESVRDTVFGSFVQAVATLLGKVPPGRMLDLWVDSLARSQAFGRVFTPVLDVVAANP